MSPLPPLRLPPAPPASTAGTTSGGPPAHPPPVPPQLPLHLRRQLQKDAVENWAFVNMPLPGAPPPALPPPPPPQVVRQQQQQAQQQAQQAAPVCTEQVQQPRNKEKQPPPVPPRAPPPPPLRTQDSTVSSDSYSQTSSPSYKNMDAPLLPPTPRATKAPRQLQRSMATAIPPRMDPMTALALAHGVKVQTPGSALIKSNSTPASLQAVVKITGSNMSLHHRIIRDMRRPSAARYLSREKIRFRLVQLLLNAIALLAIGGGLAAYLQSEYPRFPSNIRYVNKTLTTTIAIMAEDDNPSPGLCLPVIVPLCLKHGVPYNYTVFPNYMGHFTQREAQQDLEVYDAMVDVRCYELAALYLCSLFVPKCGRDGQPVRPCFTLCQETRWRCGFFVQVFGLGFPDYLSCDLFPDSTDPEVCVGQKEVLEARMRARKPVCKEGFECDRHRCIPSDWQCDGHVDCEDQSDELNCKGCGPGMIHCGKKRCIEQRHMCDGIVDCPWGQDERNCLRLSDRMGDEARGRLEVFHPQHQTWTPACVTHWDNTSSAAVCRLLGYTVANHSRLALIESGKTTVLKAGQSSNNGRGSQQQQQQQSRAAGISEEPGARTVGSQLQQSQLLREVRACPGGTFPSVELSCREYACGRRRLAERPRQGRNGGPSVRIVGGVEATPGDWPFLAALLGGPEQVFYCAGVLIADQWVLSASHCVGNQSDPTGWTVQLGMTRRHAHSYFGQKVKVRRVVPHPLHNKGTTHNNDVALFQLQTRVTFHEHLLPVCLPPPGRPLQPSTMCTVIGWGKRADRDVDYEAAVNEVAVPVLTRELCSAWLEENDANITESMICAGFPEGGRDACQGDSGGPLLCQDPERDYAWYVGGIVSWGIKCAHPRLPGVYASVPHFVPWIREQMALFSD